ncbi:hypothetical protein U9M48_040295 [Paspalum notatum var. saurae]|uniref:Xyloglucan endotransglucosylase/hydrolase n=1 Tax=Paspalum notatum var. saurae TaxID=547442 RepID=A0AAQ3UQA3_PASNO
MGQARAQLLASLAAIYLILASTHVTGSITDDLEITWGNAKVVTDSSGQQAIALTLDRSSGSAFHSKNTCLFCRIDIEIKLVPGNSAGTVTTFYMITENAWQFHDEIDIEFLGNSTGQPYTMHTNMYARGQGGREKQYKFDFDPTQDYHKYTIIWNKDWILFLVDDKLYRQIKNNQIYGAPYPSYYPMRLYATIWNADEWATQGGRVKTDWSQAPFTAYFRNYTATSCSQFVNSPLCMPGSGWFDQQLDASRQQQLAQVDSNNKIYDYCTDPRTYKSAPPRECGLN